MRPQAPHPKGLSDGANVAGPSVRVCASKQGSRTSRYLWGSVGGNKEGRELGKKEEARCTAEGKMHGAV